MGNSPPLLKQKVRIAVNKIIQVVGTPQQFKGCNTHQQGRSKVAAHHQTNCLVISATQQQGETNNIK